MEEAGAVDRGGAAGAVGVGAGVAWRVTVPSRLKFCNSGGPTVPGAGLGVGAGVAWLVAGTVCWAVAVDAASTTPSAVNPPEMLARRPLSRPASFPRFRKVARGRLPPAPTLRGRFLPTSDAKGKSGRA